MVSPARWLQLSAETRVKLKDALKIPKSGGVVVDNNASGISRVVSDGHTAKDLFEGITLQKLQEFLGSKEKDLLKLFEDAVSKVEAKVEAVVEPEKPQETLNVKKPKGKKATSSK